MAKKEKIPSLIVALLLPQAVGGLGALATNSSVSSWYRRLKKPSWNPPSQVFPVVWTALYAMMGLASWVVWSKGKENPTLAPKVNQALGFYGLQLLFNMLWSVIFFGFRRVDLALAELGVLWILALQNIRSFARISPVAAWLLVPYQAWTTFAGALNAAIWRLNNTR